MILRHVNSTLMFWYVETTLSPLGKGCEAKDSATECSVRKAPELVEVSGDQRESDV